MVHAVSRDLARSLETTEIRAMTDFYKAASAKTTRQLGIKVVESDPVTLFIVTALDVLMLNRVVGYGLQEKVDPTDIDRYTDHFRAARVARFFVQMCPVGAPDNARRELPARGIDWYNNWVKFHRPAASPLPSIESPFEVREVDRLHALRFGELICTSFGWPETAIDWVAALIGRPQWKIYGAFDHGRLIAGAAMFLDKPMAWLDFAATEETYRASGAQSALLAIRIQDAATAGIETLVAETAQDTNERQAPSFRNVQRFGFEVAYIRPNFLCTPG